MLRDIVSIPAPAPFPRVGIGGILSPQHLHPTAVVVIDLAADELLLVEGDDDEVAAWLADALPVARDALARARPGVHEHRRARRRTALRRRCRRCLNTGGKRTEFSSAAVPGLGDGSAERLGGGVSGADVIGSSGGAQVSWSPATRCSSNRLAVRETMHDPQGMVGADVLRGTVLACAADRSRRVVWQIDALAATASRAIRCGRYCAVGVVTCGACGTDNESGRKFCGECGTSLAARRARAAPRRTRRA